MESVETLGWSEAPRGSLINTKRLEENYQLYKEQRARGVVSTLPVRDYILCVLDDASGTPWEPESMKEWMSPLWPLCRALKAHPLLMGLNAEDALDSVDEATTDPDWPARIEGIEWADDGRIQFLDLWGRIKFAEGRSPVELAFQRIEDEPWTPSNRNKEELYVQFVSLAAHCQLIMEPDVIMLPVRKLAKLLGCSTMTVTRMRKFAIEDGLLTLEREHKFGGGSRKATLFRFRLDRFDANRVQVA